MNRKLVIRQAISLVVGGQDLSREMAGMVMEEIIEGKVTGSQSGAFLAAMQVKGPSPGEIAEFSRVMRSRAVPVCTGHSGTLLDTCGTGGDGMASFNISTAAAFVAAGAGVQVVKHGNRSVSSRCGSADVLEKLGVNLSVSPSCTNEIMKEIGIAFLYAPLYHPVMEKVAVTRREIGIRTIFNLLGPLTNPAGADAQLIGVYHPALTRVFAGVLRDLGTTRAMVVHGAGLDEITTTGETRVTELTGRLITERTIRCNDYGFEEVGAGDIAGGDASENARILTDVLSGEKGAHREIVLLNSGAAIYTAGKASSIQEGITEAVRSVDNGGAMGKLNALVDATGGMA
ncbi:MAG: anthranilate phosphoribosyltransferase [Methanomicrobiales archaeon]